MLGILFPIGTLYPSQQGGPSNTIYWLAKALHQSGCKVICIATDLGNPSNAVPSDTWLETDYGKVIYTREVSHQLPFKLLWHALKSIPQCNLVHLNSLFYPPSFLLAMVALLNKKSIVWSCRGNLEDAALKFSRWKKGPVLWLIRNFLVNDRVLFHATSPNEVAQINRHLGATAKVIEIPNYLALPEVLPQVTVHPPYFLYLGRIHPIKALDNLLLALDQSLQFRASEFVLKIAGEANSPYALDLQQQVKALNLEHKVEFVGHIEGDSKQRWIAGAHFLMLVSHSENFGNVVVEALAQGTPVIASKGTPWSVLEEKNAGYWSSNAPHELCSYIDAAISMPTELHEAYRSNALKLARSHFDINQNIPKWVNIYRSLISKNQ